MHPSFRLLFCFFPVSLPLTLVAGLLAAEVPDPDRSPPPPSRSTFATAPVADSPLAGFVVLVNLPERRLRVYDAALAGRIDDWTPPLAEYRVAIGTRRHRTPVFSGAVGAKISKPTWHVPRAEWAGELAGRIIPFSSRENPFRARNAEGRVEGYFITLGHRGIGLHSTREPRSIGRLASHGCIRMRLDDIRALYRLLPPGTPVTIEYRLYRVVRSDTDVRIEVFEDVYRRFSREERRAELREHLRRHGLAKEILRPEEIAMLLEGREISLADVTPHRIVAYDKTSLSAAPAAASQSAACILARAVLAMPH